MFEVEYEVGRFTFKVLIRASNPRNALLTFKKKWLKKSKKNGGKSYAPLAWVNGLWTFQELTQEMNETKIDFTQN